MNEYSIYLASRTTGFRRQILIKAKTPQHARNIANKIKLSDEFIIDL